MDNLDDEKLLQMVHDFIEYDSTNTSLTPNSYKTSSNKNNYVYNFGYSTKFLTLQKILRKKTEEEGKIEEKVKKYMRKYKEGMEKTCLKQWLVNCLMLDGFHATLRHISWLSCPSCPRGSYEYIEILQDGNGEKVRQIVDIDFKSQFEVARPSESYKELLKKIPSIFVGKEAQLSTLITLLCKACEESLIDQGLHVPPWRKPSYMNSKWNLNNNNNNNNNNNKDVDHYNCAASAATTTTTTNNNNNNNVDHYNCADNRVYYGNGNNFNGPTTRVKWVPPNKIRARVEVKGGGTRLSNQFSKMSINCC